MIAKHYILKFADSYNHYVHVKADGSPIRMSNAGMITFWLAPEDAKSYATYWTQYRFICYEVDFQLSEVL